MPCFSIIIPVYNAAESLRECLDSVCAQTFTDWEAICVDDGSSDGSGEILEEYALKDSRIKVLHQANKGVNFARQLALEESRGKWIASVDSDDWVEENFLKHYAEALASCRCDMLWTNFIRHDCGAAVVASQEFAADAKQLQRAMMLEKIWGGNFNKCYSRDFISDNHLSFPLDRRVYSCEDLCFNVNFLSCKARLKFLPVADYHYCLREGSLSRTPLTAERVMSMQYIDELISKVSLADDKEEVDLYRREALKFYAYSSKGLSDKEFLAIYPKIKSLKKFSVSLRHKILFWLSSHGLRAQVLKLLYFARSLKRRYGEMG